METIYKRAGIKESEYTLRITHKIISERNKHSCPIRISDDDDISDILSHYEDQNEITIHVVLEPSKKVKEYALLMTMMVAILMLVGGVLSMIILDFTF